MAGDVKKFESGVICCRLIGGGTADGLTVYRRRPAIEGDSWRSAGREGDGDLPWRNDGGRRSSGAGSRRCEHKAEADGGACRYIDHGRSQAKRLVGSNFARLNRDTGKTVSRRAGDKRMHRNPRRAGDDAGMCRRAEMKNG